MNEIFTREECLEMMSNLTREFLTERHIYGKARTDWHKKHEQVLRIIQAASPEYLKNKKARAMLETVIAENRLSKLTIVEKDGLARLEHEELFDTYDAAKFNCQTSEKAFAMFSSILMSSIGEAKLEQKIAPYQT